MTTTTTIDGTVEVCCHRVPYYYDIGEISQTAWDSVGVLHQRGEEGASVAPYSRRATDFNLA